ncbi:hypothetical protein BCR44DRAFT_1457810 [Catenaria anguillulae PL171]|uniref:Guanylate cyclase n=1 Tax=Catenaria anguillulae PL171 TaxID=765915 RepID=A0A1Y2I181_9FUNG|nr:hypothetical protein BCR44DRAFT_1457810 [Catenaria anguillulae PL171]
MSPIGSSPTAKSMGSTVGGSMRSPSMAGWFAGNAKEVLTPLMFVPETDPDDPVSSFKSNMDEVMQRNFGTLRNDVERMETHINLAEADVYRKEEEQFFIRADEMAVGHLLKRQADEMARLDAAFQELLDERKVRKAAKLTNKRSYKEAKTRYIKIKHQEKVKATADAVIVASEQHRRRLQQLLELVGAKHKRQRDGLRVSQQRRIKSQLAILELELRSAPQKLRDEVLFDWESKLAHQVNVDKVVADQLRDTQQDELTHRKERFELEAKAMAEVADLHIEQLRETGELEHKQKIDMILQSDLVEIAREKVSILKLTGMHHVESRKLKATHKGQLASLIRQHKSMAKVRDRKYQDMMGSELLKAVDQTNDAMLSEGGSSVGSMTSSSSASNARMMQRGDSSGSIGSVESGMSGLSGVSGFTGVSAAPSDGAETVSSDDTEAEVRAAEEAVQKLMAEDYAKANADWNAAQEQHKQMYARHKEERRRLAQQHRDQLRQVEATIKAQYDELDLAHESQRRELRKSHEAHLNEMIQFMHKEYLVSRSIRLADRTSLTERRVLGSILDSIVDAVVSITPQGIVTRFNAAAEKMFCYKADEVIGQNIKMIVSHEHAANHDQYLQNYLRTGIRKVMGSTRQVNARRKNGDEFPVKLDLSEVRDEGSVVLFTGIVRSLEAEIARETRIRTANETKRAELQGLISQLDVERFQTRNLIGQILPSTIADQLMNGDPVKPTKFNDVTVLYTDLVGFTEISSGLGPLDVVNFLNDLYSAFDEIISLYDVYKVETIGDAYMCASGVPRPNGNSHLVETAKLALHLMKAIPYIKLYLDPQDTGPVVAGVVGRKMPRYCLFGETVTIANKMESNSAPGRILLSSATHRRLETVGGSFEPRGDIVIPGKGTVKTVFLNGLTGFDPLYPIPQSVRKASIVNQASKLGRPPIVVSGLAGKGQREQGAAM